MPLIIVRQDITKMEVDAIVNAANTALQMGGGVCGAIFNAAGAADLQAACDKLAPIQTGEAVITPGFKLPAKYVIHTAGPVYQDGMHGEAQLLRACYLNSLKRAVENECESVAFPLISSGIYGYPKAEALRVATAAIQDFLVSHDLNVTLVVFDKASFAVSEKLLGEVKAYIDENYIGDYVDVRRRDRRLNVATNRIAFKRSDLHPQEPYAPAKGLDDLIGNLDEPFSATLLRLIDAKGKSDVEVYKRANLDRKLFSKIRSRLDYMPSKRTVLAFAMALELSLAETGDLLGRAGYALSPSQKFDVIVQYFIESGKYDIFEVNEVSSATTSLSWEGERISKGAVNYVVRLFAQKILGWLFFLLGSGWMMTWQAWVYFGAGFGLTAGSVVAVHRANPAILAQRGKAVTDSPWWDKALLGVFWLLNFFVIYF